MKKLSNKGFTIIELLIATMVFTSVLLLCMEGITRIARVYVKNVSISRANDFSKSFMNDIAGQIKFGSHAPTQSISGNTIYVCSGGKVFRIILNDKNVTAVKKKPLNTCTVGGYSVANFFDDADNLAPSSMRVLDFSLTNSGQGWDIKMRVAIGDNDLLVDGIGKDLTATTVYSDFKTATCKGGIRGSEFCAVIPLSTSVTRRMN